MHDYGVAGRLRHIGGNQELAMIHDILESYSRGISEGWIAVNRKLEPGDMLIYECVYDNRASSRWCGASAGRTRCASWR